MKAIRLLMPFVALLLFASGCGGQDKQSKADRAAINAEFAQIDFRIAQWTMGPGPTNQETLEALTRRYAATARKYKDDLGEGEVNRRLSQEAEQVGPSCPPCVEILRHEAESG
jgi:hypothetical protein